ncbi:protein-L-isoaspartate O-methyltransferase family protein [Candidatus Symbiobacter mobilis]|uniref:Protein-L-isoaspartate O-methyltransferase n=1 Tax=Candidatus Symbiobacter mobilis CR TaxID=946483 RepID=U5NBG1_9BURK|nr:protein-L-isoaspartate O-methyltransferase [Candidatus Symbiobacter mobilis]AGX88660.1 protein-L-isoaspartate carboxymethylmethyltransferase [Candidatus Symbiobacter mobilis CR]
MPLPDIERARHNMVEQQVRPWSVSHPQVLHLLAHLKREDFVPEAYRSLSFADIDIPLPCGQTMLRPGVQARLLQDATVQPGDKVLEIGVGTGFMTAMLARMGSSVLGLEIHPELAAIAEANLRKACIHNVTIRQTDGARGAELDAPFDLIVLGGSVAEVPQVLLNQLKPHGRLIAIVGEEPAMQAQTITRSGNTRWDAITHWETSVPRLLRFPQASPFRFA